MSLFPSTACSVICLYLGSKILSGKRVFGKKIALLNGKTGISDGRSDFSNFFFIIYLSKIYPILPQPFYIYALTIQYIIGFVNTCGEHRSQNKSFYNHPFALTVP